MNHTCASCSFSCGSNNKPPAVAYPHRSSYCIDPLIPASLNTRPYLKKANQKCITNKKGKQFEKNPKRTDKDPNESALNSVNCPRRTNSIKIERHPCDCACSECEKCTKGLSSIDKRVSHCETEMTNPRAERNMKNYLNDNSQLCETNFKKSTSCCDALESSSTDEIWVLQCPKGFDPKTIINIDLCKLQKDNSSKIDFTAKRFNEKLSLACLTPEKAAEYAIICDNIKILETVGKIVVSENQNDLSRKSSRSDCFCESLESCSDAEINDDDDGEQCQNPIASKKSKKKFNDQKFTIETTVIVENCNDRKKNKGKIKQDSCGECLPLVPPEPVPAKKQKNMKKIKEEEEDLDWLNC